MEKEARGLGVGRALVEQCVRSAREKGYKKMTLWTQSILVAARNIYQDVGFQRVAEEKHHSFGVDLIRRDLGAGVLMRITRRAPASSSRPAVDAGSPYGIP